MSRRRSTSIESDLTPSLRRSTRLRTVHVDSPTPAANTSETNKRSRRSQSIQEKTVSEITKDLQTEDSKSKIARRRTSSAVHIEVCDGTEHKSIRKSTDQSNAESTTPDNSAKKRVTRSMSRSPVNIQGTVSTRKTRLSLNEKSQAEVKPLTLDVICENEEEISHDKLSVAVKKVDSKKEMEDDFSLMLSPDANNALVILENIDKLGKSELNTSSQTKAEKKSPKKTFTEPDIISLLDTEKSEILPEKNESDKPDEIHIDTKNKVKPSDNVDKVTDDGHDLNGTAKEVSDKSNVNEIDNTKDAEVYVHLNKLISNNVDQDKDKRSNAYTGEIIDLDLEEVVSEDNGTIDQIKKEDNITDKEIKIDEEIIEIKEKATTDQNKSPKKPLTESNDELINSSDSEFEPLVIETKVKKNEEYLSPVKNETLESVGKQRQSISKIQELEKTPNKSSVSKRLKSKDLFESTESIPLEDKENFNSPKKDKQSKEFNDSSDSQDISKNETTPLSNKSASNSKVNAVSETPEKHMKCTGLDSLSNDEVESTETDNIKNDSIPLSDANLGSETPEKFEIQDTVNTAKENKIDKGFDNSSDVKVERTEKNKTEDKNLSKTETKEEHTNSFEHDRESIDNLSNPCSSDVQDISDNEREEMSNSLEANKEKIKSCSPSFDSSKEFDSPCTTETVIKQKSDKSPKTGVLKEKDSEIKNDPYELDQKTSEQSIVEDFITSFIADKKQTEIETEEKHKEKNKTENTNAMSECSDLSETDTNFILNEASEGSEVTPSVDSNEIIEIGESIGSSDTFNDSDFNDDDDDDNNETDSFINDDTDNDVISSSDSDALFVHGFPTKIRRKRTQIMISSTSSSSEEELEKLSTEPSLVSVPQISSAVSKLENENVTEEVNQVIEYEDEKIKENNDVQPATIDMNINFDPINKDNYNDLVKKHFTEPELPKTQKRQTLGDVSQSINMDNSNVATTKRQTIDVIPLTVQTPTNTCEISNSVRTSIPEISNRKRSISLEVNTSGLYIVSPLKPDESISKSNKVVFNVTPAVNELLQDFSNLIGNDSKIKDSKVITKQGNDETNENETPLEDILSKKISQQSKLHAKRLKRKSKVKVFENIAEVQFLNTPIEKIKKESKHTNQNSDTSVSENISQPVQRKQQRLKIRKLEELTETKIINTPVKETKAFEQEQPEVEQFDNLVEVNIFDTPDEKTKLLKKQKKPKVEQFDNLAEVNIFNTPVTDKTAPQPKRKHRKSINAEDDTTAKEKSHKLKRKQKKIVTKEFNNSKSPEKNKDVHQKHKMKEDSTEKIVTETPVADKNSSGNKIIKKTKNKKKKKSKLETTVPQDDENMSLVESVPSEQVWKKKTDNKTLKKLKPSSKENIEITEKSKKLKPSHGKKPSEENKKNDNIVEGKTEQKSVKPKHCTEKTTPELTEKSKAPKKRKHSESDDVKTTIEMNKQQKVKKEKQLQEAMPNLKDTVKQSKRVKKMETVSIPKKENRHKLDESNVQSETNKQGKKKEMIVIKQSKNLSVSDSNVIQQKLKEVQKSFPIKQSKKENIAEEFKTGVKPKSKKVQEDIKPKSTKEKKQQQSTVEIPEIEAIKKRKHSSDSNQNKINSKKPKLVDNQKASEKDASASAFRKNKMFKLSYAGSTDDSVTVKSFGTCSNRKIEIKPSLSGFVGGSFKVSNKSLPLPKSFFNM